MNNIFFTADLHLGHKAIVNFASRNFKTIEEHDDCLIENYNSVVGRKDVVYILGDLAWNNHRHYIHALNGKKVLVLGNHDKMSQFDYSLFTEICYVKELKYNKQKIFLSHYPHKSWNGSCHCSKPNSNFLGHLYGHSHGRMEEDRIAFDVGVDVWKLRPIDIETVIKKFEWMKASICFSENNISLINNDNWIL